jgi:hypothetical protein
MAHWVTYTSYSLSFDGADMTDDETEFLLAVASYQKRFGRRYPTWREVLNILRCLGYRKVAEAVPICEPPPPSAARDEKTPRPKLGPHPEVSPERSVFPSGAELARSPKGN